MVFAKTKMCKFHILGMCAQGDQCRFAHNKSELSAPPDLSCTKLCKKLLSTGSCEDPTCRYAHNREQLRQWPSTNEPTQNTVEAAPMRQMQQEHGSADHQAFNQLQSQYDYLTWQSSMMQLMSDQIQAGLPRGMQMRVLAPCQFEFAPMSTQANAGACHMMTGAVSQETQVPEDPFVPAWGSMHQQEKKKYNNRGAQVIAPEDKKDNCVTMPAKQSNPVSQARVTSCSNGAEERVVIKNTFLDIEESRAPKSGLTRPGTWAGALCALAAESQVTADRDEDPHETLTCSDVVPPVPATLTAKGLGCVPEEKHTFLRQMSRAESCDASTEATVVEKRMLGCHVEASGLSSSSSMSSNLSLLGEASYGGPVPAKGNDHLSIQQNPATSADFDVEPGADSFERGDSPKQSVELDPASASNLFCAGGLVIKNTFLDYDAHETKVGLRSVRTCAGRLDAMDS